MRSRSPKLRGGRHQRSAAAAAASAASSSTVDCGGKVDRQFDSEQAWKAVHDWAWGLTSAAQTQAECAVAVRDRQRLLRQLGAHEGFASKSLSAIASLGGDGRRQSNIKRDLVTFLGEPDLPEPHMETIPMVVAKPCVDDTVIADNNFLD